MIVNRHIFPLTVFFSLIISTPSFSQDRNRVGKEIGLLINYWDQHYPNHNSSLFKGDTSMSGPVILLTGNGQSISSSGESEYLRARAAFIKNDPGLSGSASFLENFTPAVDDDNLIYQRRVQAGINWDVLDGGYIENKHQQTILENKARINDHLEPLQQKEDRYSETWNKIVFLFNREKVQVLQKRKELIVSLSETAEALHYDRFLSKEDYLKIQSRKAETEAMLRIYADFNEKMFSENDRDLPSGLQLAIPDIHYVTVLSSLDTNGRYTLLRLVQENISLENKLLNELRLQTGLRYNYYDLITPGNRNFFSLFVNFSIPIAFRKEERIALIRAQTDYSWENLRERFDGMKKELLTDCYEYRYKLRQYIGFWQKFLLYEELIRKQQALRKMDDEKFNPAEGLLLLDDLYGLELELLDLKQQLYLRLLRIYTRSGVTDLKEIAYPFELPNYFDLDRKVDRSVYVWSSTIRDNSAHFLSEYMKFQQADKVLFSCSEDIREKCDSLVQMLNSKSIEAHLMIGSNKILTAASPFEEVKKRMAMVNTKGLHGIHLDIEPHTFEDWEAQKETYLKFLEELITITAAHCHERNLELSVSIPFSYPENWTNRVISITDRVYFMGYENVKPEYLERKISSYTGNMEKIALALRTEDFASRIDLELFLIEFYQKIELKHIAIHDAGRLLEWDKKAVEGK